MALIPFLSRGNCSLRLRIKSSTAHKSFDRGIIHVCQQLNSLIPGFLSSLQLSVPHPVRLIPGCGNACTTLLGLRPLQFVIVFPFSGDRVIFSFSFCTVFFPYTLNYAVFFKLMQNRVQGAVIEGKHPPALLLYFERYLVAVPVSSCENRQYERFVTVFGQV